MSAAGAKGQTRVEEPTAAQRMIARRAAEARATVPDLELRDEAEMTAALALAGREGCSVASILLRACALALREVPRANGAYRDGRFELYSRINVGVVVAAGEEYLIPTVFDADRKRIHELSVELKELQEAARGGRLGSAAYSGATFTLAPAAEDAVASSTILTTPPQAAAVAAGAVREAPVVRDGAVVAAPMVALTLACDHRIVYAAPAARFLTAIRTRLERTAL